MLETVPSFVLLDIVCNGFGENLSNFVFGQLPQYTAIDQELVFHDTVRVPLRPDRA